MSAIASSGKISNAISISKLEAVHTTESLRVGLTVYYKQYGSRATLRESYANCGDGIFSSYQ